MCKRLVLEHCKSYKNRHIVHRSCRKSFGSSHPDMWIYIITASQAAKSNYLHRTHSLHSRWKYSRLRRHRKLRSLLHHLPDRHTIHSYSHMIQLYLYLRLNSLCLALQHSSQRRLSITMEYHQYKLHKTHDKRHTEFHFYKSSPDM